MEAAGNSEPFKVSKGACHRARVQGAYVYTVFDIQIWPTLRNTHPRPLQQSQEQNSGARRRRQLLAWVFPPRLEQ